MPHVGIYGLPQSGKSTLFALLTQSRGGTTRREGPVVLETAVVPFPDSRLDALHALVGSQQKVPATFTLVDVAGYPPTREKGHLGPLRNLLARMDALMLVVRAFPAAHVPHPLGEVNPQRDIDLLEGELLLYDLEVLENRLARLREERQKAARPKEVIAKERQVLERLAEALRNEVPLRAVDLSPDEAALIEGFGLLSRKPLLVVVNIGEGAKAPDLRLPQAARAVTAALALEAELQTLEPDEGKEFRAMYGLTGPPARERILQALRETLGLITFYTYNERECRAWMIPRGSTAVDAAGRIHTDMAKGFIRAEVWPAEAFIAAGGDTTALRQQGLWRVEGRDYLVQDGDILYIRFQR